LSRRLEAVKQHPAPTKTYIELLVLRYGKVAGTKVYQYYLKNILREQVKTGRSK
jgi:hypothetical protein